ncbi:MAG: amino acid-binding protein, partial [Acidimicrobiales bacterium]
MVTYVVRVWIPDRPGALGAVASRIGAVRGDVVGIDILERGAGVAVDELVVMLPDDDLVALLISEIGQVDGVVVEDLRPAPGPLPDPRVAALESAELLVQQRTPAAVVGALADHA